MHSDQRMVRELYYGTDGRNLFLRLDLEGTPEFNRVELRTGEKVLSLLDNPEIQWVRGKILEIKIPQLPPEFQLAIFQDDLLQQAIPPDGRIRLA